MAGKLVRIGMDREFPRYKVDIYEEGGVSLIASHIVPAAAAQRAVSDAIKRVTHAPNVALERACILLHHVNLQADTVALPLAYGSVYVTPLEEATEEERSDILEALAEGA